MRETISRLNNTERKRGILLEDTWVSLRHENLKISPFTKILLNIGKEMKTKYTFDILFMEIRNWTSPSLILYEYAMGCSVIRHEKKNPVYSLIPFGTNSDLMVCVFWYSYIFTHIRRLTVVKMFYEPT